MCIFKHFFFFWWKSYHQKYASRTQEYASNQQKLGAGNIHGILIPTFPITANNLSENQAIILGFPTMDADWSSLSPKIDVTAWENERFSITCCFTSARYNGRKKTLFFHAFAKKMHDGTKRKMQHRNYQEVPKNVPDADTRFILTTNYITCSAKLIVQILGAGSSPSDYCARGYFLLQKWFQKRCFREQCKSIN